MLDPFDGPVVEVKVGHLKRLRAWHARRFPPHGKSMVLRRDKYLSRSEIAYWMGSAPVSVWQLDRLAAHRQAKQLMTETDPEDRQRPVRQLTNRCDRVVYRRGASDPVRPEDEIWLER